MTVGAAEQIIPSPQALCCHSNEAATAHTGYTEAGSPNETPCCKGTCVVGVCVRVCVCVWQADNKISVATQQQSKQMSTWWSVCGCYVLLTWMTYSFLPHSHIQGCLWPDSEGGILHCQVSGHPVAVWGGKEILLRAPGYTQHSTATTVPPPQYHHHSTTTTVHPPVYTPATVHPPVYTRHSTPTSVHPPQ